MKRFAAIDIGTNTILMLIAEVFPDGKYTIIRDEHSIARLGENLNTTCIISEKARNRAIDILQKYRQICSSLEVSRYRICATSALRDAENKHEVLDRLGSAIGYQIEIISGNEEAALSFTGTANNNLTNLVLDIGGGSTEYIIGKGDEILFRKSINIGAVRMTEKFISSHPPDEIALQSLTNYISNAIQESIHVENNFNDIYAVAGTPTTLAAIALGLGEYSDEKVDGYKLQLDELISISESLVSNSIEYLIQKMNIHPWRADVITAGAIILIESLKHLGKSECTVSIRGLRYGILESMLNN